MSLCTCCRAPLNITQSHRVRVVHYPGILYGLMFECPGCGSTQCHVLWRAPDEDEAAEEEAA